PRPSVRSSWSTSSGGGSRTPCRTGRAGRSCGEPSWALSPEDWQAGSWTGASVRSTRSSSEWSAMGSAHSSSAPGERGKSIMLLKNLRIEDAESTSDIRVTDGVFAAIEPQLEPLEGEEVVDAGGRLGLPPIIESHVHLDSALTAGEPRWNESGTLFEGIEVWSERKRSLTL